MASIAINNIKSSAPISRKSEQTAWGTQKNTFQNVLLETIDNKSAANKNSTAYRPGYTLSASNNNITDYIEEAETDEVMYSPRLASWATTIGGIPVYEDVEINGVWVKQVTDECLELMGYNIEILEANDIGDNLLKYVKYINGYAVVPRFVIPFDVLYETDYKRILATPENLEKTIKNNADADGNSIKNIYLANNKQINQNSEKTVIEDIKEIVKENSIIQNSVQKLSGSIEQTEKTIINNVALKVLNNFNVLNSIWNLKDKEEEKSNV